MADENPWIAVAADLERVEGQQARANIIAAKDANPDVAARAIEVSKRLGVPVDVAERNIADFEAIDTSNRYDRILRESPLLQRWMAEPVNARVATSLDVPKLAGMEKLWTGATDLARSPPAGAVQAIGGGLKGIGEGYKAVGELGQAGLDALVGRPVRTFDMPWFLSPSEIVGRPGAAIKGFGEAIDVPQERQTFATDVSKGVGQIAGQIAAVLATGGGPSFAMLFGQGVDQMADDVKKAGKQGTVAGNLTLLSGGAATAIAEKIGLDLLLDRVPPAIKNKILRKITDVALAGGIEAAEEAIEQVAQNALANHYLGTKKPLLEGAGDAASVAGVSAALVRAMLGVRFKRGGKGDTEQPVVDAENMDRMLAAVRDTDLAGRSPEKMAEFLSGLGPGNVYVPAEALRTYFQQIEPEQAASIVRALGVGDQMQQAMAAGGDVVIPLATYAAHAPEDMTTALRDDIRLRAAGMSVKEAKAFEKDDGKELGKQITARMEEATRLDAARDQVVPKVERMMQGAGEAPEAARQIATLYGERYLTRAARSGLTADDAVKAFARSGLDVKSDLFPATPETDAVPDIADAVADAQAIVEGEKAAAKARKPKAPKAVGVEAEGATPAPAAPSPAPAPAPAPVEQPAKPPSSTGFTEAFDSLKGGGVSEDFFKRAFDAFNKGSDRVAGIVEPRLRKARADGITFASWEDVRAYYDDPSAFTPTSPAAPAPVAASTPPAEAPKAGPKRPFAGIMPPDIQQTLDIMEAVAKAGDAESLQDAIEAAQDKSKEGPQGPEYTSEQWKKVAAYGQDLQAFHGLPERADEEPAAPVEQPAPAPVDAASDISATALPTRQSERDRGKFKGLATTRKGRHRTAQGYGNTPEEAQQSATDTLKAKIEPPKPDRFAGNKLFTSDKVEAARERLRSKLRNQVNSGFDPEIMLDGITIAGAYIEAGVRDFASYAKAMTDDLGEAIRPYLLSFYEGVRNYPGLDTAGMTPPEEAARLHAGQGENTSEGSTGEEPGNAGNQDGAGESDAGTGATGVPEPEGKRDAGADAGAPDGGVSAERGDGDGPGDGRVEPTGQPDIPARPDEAGAGVRDEGQDRGGDRAGAGDRGDRQPASDYRYQPGDLTRDRSWRGVAERNVEAVELVKKLEAEDRRPTAEESALLARFTGWGASEIANGIFPDPRTGQFKPEWRELGERLRAALNDEEYAAARRSTQYAHYTSEGVIRSIYGALERLGFTGGKVLEPGMGIGLFKGLMPESMAADSQYHGIERDPITGAIATALYPRSNIQVADFTEVALPKDYYDAAIGNPPFSSAKILNDPEYRSRAFMLHDYFFAKTIDRVKPGGLVVFVTSKGTMDKGNDRARKYMADRADLLGAIRLPQTAFKDNAGTEVVTDVLFLKRRAPGAEAGGEAWLGTKEVETPQGPTAINEYFADHPAMVLGSHALTGSMYRQNEYTVIPRAGDIEQQFAVAVQNLPEGVYRPRVGSAADVATVIERDFDPKAKKEGSVYVDDAGQLRIVDQGSGMALVERVNTAGKALPLKPKEIQFLKDYVGLRDALKQAQYDQLNEGDWQASLATLNRAYDAFVKVHGRILAHSVTERPNEDGTTTVITRWKNAALLRFDAESALVRALEEVRPDGAILPSKLLTARTLNKPSTPVVNSVQDALLVQLNRQGKLDMAEVARLAGLTEADAIEQLGDAIYNDPSSGWVTADAYLSGNVVRKLKEARQAARSDQTLGRNVSALEAVQPKPLAPADITAKLGAGWIPASDVAAFASEVIGERMSVTYSPLLAVWSVEGDGRGVSEWNTEGMSAPELLETSLNSKEIKVTERVSDGHGGYQTIVNPAATEAANAVAKRMDEQFRRWLWSSPQRAVRLASFYNEHYNNLVPRSFDGQHLTLPGISSRFNLYPHQKRAIWRTIQDGNTYLAHSVGAGKTFTMIAAGMEERRLGLIKKPMYVVPNHMLAQFSREFQELYPTAHVMVADEESFHTNNRRQFVARAALNDPDAIIITHSAFGRIAVSDEFSDRYILSLIDEYLALKEEVDASDRVTVKKIERRLEQLESRLSGKTDQSKKDRALTFEELGVDRLYVDEFHEFRKLDFPTNRGNIKGIDPSGSQRAMDLHMKLQYLESRNPNRSVVAASGTPVTNTMGELFTAQRFLQPKQLQEDGLSSFDAWANQFGEVVSGFEQNPSGGYEVVARFARFVNVPDLMRRVRSFMDVLTGDQLAGLVQRPTIKGGGREIVVTPAPDGYAAYQKTLEARINAIRARRGRPQKGDDIILKVISDGRFSAIDLRFVEPGRPNDPDSKLNRMLDDVIAAYHDTGAWEYHTEGTADRQKGATLLVFTDIGLGEASARNRGFDMKDWMVRRLIEGGVAPDHIAFMRDHHAHAKKEKLFADMRQGAKRILIGGKDMETGVNVQKRLAHLFHLDSPWFPASVEQREGRIVRQGNQNKTVQIRAYATKGSYDSTMWGMNARKQRFITQALQGSDSVRAMDDVSEASAFEMASALASGDERYLKVAGLRSDVDRLNRLFSAHEQEQRNYRSRIAGNERIIERTTAEISRLEAAIGRRQDVTGDAFKATIDGVAVENREEFGDRLFGVFKSLADAHTEGTRTIGTIGGFDILYSGITLTGSGSFAAAVDLDIPESVTASSSPLLIYPIDPQISVKGLAARAVNRLTKLDETLRKNREAVAEAVRGTELMQSRLGAPFPELAELMEKQAAIEALEAELAAESANTNTEQDAASPPEAGDERTFNQAPDGGTIRGNIVFSRTAAGETRATMNLLKSRDLSTVLHETGHLWLEELHIDASSPAAPKQLKDDLQKVRDRLGAKGDEPITVEQHEEWARMVEAYLMEGKSPSVALSDVFARFKAWLVSIYKTALRLNVEINDDMRGVMDRLIATDEAIAEMRSEIGARQLFASADQAGMTEAGFKAYTASVAASRDKAEQAVLGKLMEQVRQRRTAEWNAEKKAVQDEVSGMVDSQPDLVALNYLRTGQVPDGLAHVRDLPRLRLSREALIEEYGDPAIVDALPRSVPPLVTDKDGARPGDIAELLGFPDGRSMVDALARLGKEQAALREAKEKRSVRQMRIETETDRIMRERHGDMLNDGSIEAEALEALHNEARSDVLAEEVRALARKVDKKPTPYAIAARWAKQAIAGRTVVDVQDLAQFTRAEARAAKAAEQAFIKGDADEALRRKEEQMIAHALWMEAAAAKREIEKARAMMEKLAGARTIRSMDQDYLDKIHDLLERFDLKARSLKATERLESLRQWAEAQQAAGIDVAVPEKLLDEAYRTSYRRLSVEEFRGLSDSVKQLAHLGRMKQKFLDNKERREFEEVVEEAVDVAGQGRQSGDTTTDVGKTNFQRRFGRVASLLRSADAALLKVEYVFKWLDGNKSAGPFSRLFERMSQAQAAERDQWQDMGGKLHALFHGLPVETRRRLQDVATYPELNGDSLRRDALIAVALNMGNEGNKAKMLKAHDWTEEGVIAALERGLNGQEMQFVQDVWDLIETLWPDIAKLEREVNGVEPEKVEATELITRHGTFRGGYYPLVYDPKRPAQAGDHVPEITTDTFGNPNYTRATTPHGFTKERVERFNRPIHLSLDVIPRHIMEVIHDLHWRQPIMDGQRFLSDARIKNAIREKLGREYEAQLQPWLNDMALEYVKDRQGMAAWDAFMKGLRTNVTMVGMGYRLTTIMAQIGGYSDSTAEIGTRWMASGFKTWAAHPVSSAAFVRERSGEMRHRSDNLDRDIRQIVREMGDRQSPLAAVRSFAFRGITYADAAVTVPTWLGAYNKALHEGRTEAEAIEYGDQMVRQSQGAGSTKDLVRLQRDTETMKLFTIFYSYFSHYYNAQRDVARRFRDAETPADFGDALARAFWLNGPGVLAAAMLSGQGPEDDETWGAWASRVMFFNLFMGIPIVRDLANLASNAVAGKYIGGYQISPAGQAIETVGKLAASDIPRLVRGEEASRVVKHGIMAAGYALGLPTGQVGTTTQFLYDALAAGREHPETLHDWMSGLAYGPTRK